MAKIFELDIKTGVIKKSQCLPKHIQDIVGYMPYYCHCNRVYSKSKKTLKEIRKNV